MSIEAPQLLAFYGGLGVDHRDRTLEEVLRLSISAMEGTHDYIQWLFPLDVVSSVTPNAPLVDDACKVAFRSDPTLRANLRRSLDKMLGFYGMKLASDPTGDDIARATFFAQRTPHWLTLGNHNYMRITRMLKSLVLLGQEQLAASLLKCLEALYLEFPQAIGSTTIRYWRNAVPSAAPG